MADWVTGKVTKVQNWTDALFSLTVHAPVLPFTAGQFTKLGLEIDGERVQRAYSYVNSPDNPDLSLPCHRPRWQIKPTIGGTETRR
ncbi:hypothetical protein ACNKHT_25950 [Shigella flexneri]